MGVVVVPPLSGTAFRALAEANPDLMRIGPIADAVGATMGTRPDTPAGTDPTVVEFTIAEGASATDITDELVARGLVTDRLAFTWLLAHGQTTLWWVLGLVALVSAAYLQRLPRTLPAVGKRVTNRSEEIVEASE